MPKRVDALSLEALGDLANYDHDDLATLREKLIDDIAQLEQENRHLDRKIKECNEAKQALVQRRAQRSRALRALKHELHLRGRSEGSATLVAHGRPRGRMLRP